jgi:hypothetical protein
VAQGRLRAAQVELQAGSAEQSLHSDGDGSVPVRELA